MFDEFNSRVAKAFCQPNPVMSTSNQLFVFKIIGKHSKNNMNMQIQSGVSLDTGMPKFWMHQQHSVKESTA